MPLPPGYTPPDPSTLPDWLGGTGSKPSGVFGHLNTELKGLGNTLKSLPGGLLQMGLEGARTIGGIGEFAYHALPGGPEIRRGPEGFRHYAPLADSLAKSVSRTVERGTNLGASLAPGGLKPSETKYAQAIDKGQLLTTLLEDVGNVAIAGSIASKPLTAGAKSATTKAAGLTTRAEALKAARPISATSLADAASLESAAARATSRASSLSNVAGKTRLLTNATNRALGEPAILPFRAAGAVVKPPLRALKNAALKTPTGNSIYNSLTQLGLTAASRPFFTTMQRGAAEIADITHPMIEAGRTIDKLLPNDISKRAMFSHLMSEPTLVNQLRDSLGDTATTSILDGVNQDLLSSATPESQLYAADFARGTLPPKEMVAMQKAIDLWMKEVSDPATQRFLAQWGERDLPTKSDLDLAQEQVTSHEPLQLVGNRLQSQYQPRFDAAETAIQRAATPTAESRAIDRSMKLEDEFTRNLETVNNEITSAPARYRNVISLHRAAQESVGHLAAASTNPATQAFLTSLQGEIATSLRDIADQIPDPVAVKGGQVPTASPNDAAVVPRLPVSRALGLEKMKETTIGPRTPREVISAMAPDIRQGVLNNQARYISDQWGTTGRKAGLPANTDIRALEALMQKDGKVAWNPRDPRGNVQKVTIDTIFIPKWMKEGFAKYAGEPGAFETLFREVYDRPMRTWKAGVLALSPRWQVGNIIGNTFMATAGGVTPTEMLRHFPEAFRQARSQSPTTPRRLRSRSLGAEDYDYMYLNPSDSRLAKMMAPISKVADISFRANQVVDSTFKNILYLAEMEKKGGRAAGGAASEAAVNRALEVLGDFTNLLPFEQQVLRRVMPFYPWIKHITKLSYKLARDNPGRVAWTLAMGQAFNPDPRTSEFPLTEGAYAMGGDQFLPLNALNPFGGAFDPLHPLELGSTLTPALQTPANLLGWKMTSHGPEKLTRPYGSGRADPYGKEYGGAVQNPGQAAYILSGLFPQSRLVRDLFMGDKLRYNTGEPIPKGRGTIESGRSNLNPLMSFLGVPWPTTIDLEDLIDRRDERLKAMGRAAPLTPSSFASFAPRY